MTADSDLSAESAGVLGVLGDFHLLHLLTERGTITVGLPVSMAVLRDTIDTIPAGAVTRSDCARGCRDVGRNELSCVVGTSNGGPGPSLQCNFEVDF